MTATTRFRLEGLEPDNLLAFLALLGTLRALDASRMFESARAFWSVDEPPVRPVLDLDLAVSRSDVVAAVAGGIDVLADEFDFDGRKDLKLAPDDGRRTLLDVRKARRWGVWSALVSDAAVVRDGKELERTPLCLMVGQGHQHFLARLALVPKKKTPPDRGRGRARVSVSEDASLSEALFDPWVRADRTDSFRWDHREDVRYALRAHDPTDSRTKETTQHGANRLAAVALPMLVVSPRGSTAGGVRLAIRGGSRDSRGRFTFSWPIWTEPVGFPSIVALLDHPSLAEDVEVRQGLGVAEVRKATRVAGAGRNMNFTRGEAVSAESS